MNEFDQKGAVTTVRIDYSGGNTEHVLFLASDLHVDAVSCNRSAMLADLQEAVNKNAMIFLFGDVFDAMQGRFDPRRSLDELRPEYRRNDYYDFVVKDVAKILSPFAKNIVLISEGNHETATQKNSNISLIDRLVWLLNTQYGGSILHGGYGGWVRFMLTGAAGGRSSVKMKYFHGAGGDSPVTRGVIQTNRQAVYLNGADIVVNGHCFDEQTEILTPYGWKKNNEVEVGTEILSLNRETGLLETNKVSAVHRFDNYNNLIRLNSRTSDLLITDQHGLYVAKTDYGAKKYLRWSEAEWYPETAESAFGKPRQMLNAGIEDNRPLEISDTKLRVIAWIMTEGGIESNSRTIKDGIPGVIRISQSDAPDGRLAVLEKDLNDAGIKFTKTKRIDDGKIHRNFDAYRYNILNVKDEWNWIGRFIKSDKNPLPLLYRMSLKQRLTFIETWILADGNMSKAPAGKKWTAFQLATNNKIHVDFLQNILFRSGFRSHFGLNKKTGVYWIACSKRMATTISKTNWSKETYSGQVWCVTVPNGTVVARRNGKCTITMNSHNAYYVPIIQESVSDSGKVIFSTQHHIRTPGYKSEYNDGTAGWAVEKGMVPKPLGGAFVTLRITTGGKAKRVACQIGVQPVIHEPVTMELW